MSLAPKIIEAHSATEGAYDIHVEVDGRRWRIATLPYPTDGDDVAGRETYDTAKGDIEDALRVAFVAGKKAAEAAAVTRLEDPEWKLIDYAAWQVRRDLAACIRAEWGWVDAPVPRETSE